MFTIRSMEEKKEKEKEKEKGKEKEKKGGEMRGKGREEAYVQYYFTVYILNALTL